MLDTRMLGRAAAAVGLGALLLTGCSTSDSSGDATSTQSGDVVRMWIGPELVDCEGVAPMQCMQVSYAEDGEPQLFYDQISGFEYAEGTSYVVDVEVTEVAEPPADASSLQYTLVDVVSETPQ